jgi:hypothetical protein
MANTTLPIENRNIKPTVVRPKSGGPDDRADVFPFQVLRQRLRVIDTGRFESLRRLTKYRVMVDPFVNCVEQTIHLEVGQCADISQ